MLDVWLKTGSIFLLILIGAIVRRRGIMDAALTKNLAVMLTSVFYPGLIFSTIVSEFTWGEILDHWVLPAGSALIMIVGFIVGGIILTCVSLQDAKQRRTFRFQCTMNNYSFLPMMLALLFWDQRGLALVIYSTVGAELVVWTIGVYTLSGQSLRLANLKYLLNMPLFAMLAAGVTLALSAGAESAGLPIDEGLSGAIGGMFIRTLQVLGDATIPVAALIAGSRMAGLHPSHYVTPPALGVTFCRLILIPAVAVGILLVLPLPENLQQVLLLVAVMPCAITSVTLCEVFDADSDFGAATVLITHVVAVVTIPLWLTLLSISGS